MMSTRWYLAPITGDGRTPETAYRANVPVGYGECGAFIPSNNNGTPANTWCLCDITVADQTAYLNDASLIALPDISATLFLTQAQADAFTVAVGKVSASVVTFSAGMTPTAALGKIQTMISSAVNAQAGAA